MNPFGDHSHEPAVRNERLRELVEFARRQPTPRVELELETIQRGLSEQRAQARRGWIGLAAAAVVVAALVSVWEPEPGSSMQRSPEATVVVATETPSHPEVHAPPSVIEDAPVVEPTRVAASKPRKAPEDDLDPGVRVQSVEGTQAPAVLGRWEVAVAAGRYVIEVAPTTEQVVLVRVGDRVLEVEPGAHVEIDAKGSSNFDLKRGRAQWQPQAPRARAPSAEVLARAADAKMAAGDARAARRLLERLVRTYPKHAVTPAALLDLARLLRTAGHEARARCAYELYRTRYGDTALRGELARVLDELGPGSGCRGLTPRRT